jgi:peptidoglycan/xylan/chitin deacetylase (PgdA/CDA1 family)/glycosyltransferase involved in cell wall biosynthesis/SAM-dependent methyltransferase
MAAMARIEMTPGSIVCVITCHNLGRTLPAALESVERQSRPAAEIVIVDDGSSDLYTRQVLARVQREGTRVVQAGGRGASAARNLGAQLTTSAYLVCLDGDDTFETGYFDRAAARLDAQPDLDFVSCAMRAFEGASYVWSPAAPTFVEAIATGGVPHASTMMRRRLWEAVGGFDESLQSFELLDFWASAIESGVRGVILAEPFLNYRVRAGSGYRRSIQPDIYLARLQHFYGKHRAAVERHALELIERKEAFLISQRDYLLTLESRKASINAELGALRQEIGGTVAALASRGLSRVEWGDLLRRQPLSQQWGRDRGLSIDRHYIEGFLEKHRADVRGRVLEVRDSIYTQRFGGEAVTTRDVVDLDAANGLANVIADLRHAEGIAAGTYDCIILTQTLQLIDDIPSVLAECDRILRPGGVLLATVPSVIRVDDEGGPDGDFWRLTEASARKLFADVFPIEAFDVTAYGNVMACSAFLYGLSAEELAPADLNHVDPIFPVVIAIRAVKPEESVGSTRNVGSGFSRTLVAPKSPTRETKAAILAYHRVARLTPDSHALCTPPDIFREHMAFIRREFSPISLGDLVQAAASGDIPERAVAVTLDDGYLDALTLASPILTEIGVPATFFVNTDRLDEEHERWWDILERIFLCEGTLPSVLALTLGDQNLRMPAATSSERMMALESLNRTTWPMDANGRASLVADVVAWSKIGAGARSSHRVLTGEEIRLLGSRPGHAIGAHTVHHLALTTQALDTKRREIIEDKIALERLLNRPVDLFSYPYGDFDADTRTIAAEARFRAAVTVEDGMVSAGTNRLLLPRYEITQARAEHFAPYMREIFSLDTV